jgi:3,4-dihydroxy 2-butanone 4-phosphate synthase/GTP cyclohydrolase II
MARAPQGVLVLLNCQESAPQLAAQFDRMGRADDSLRRKGRMDLRTYGIGAQILRAEGVGRMRLLGAARKMPSMHGFGLEITGFEPNGAAAAG